ncbi:leucine-rich repeat domain-containing protein, partial [Eubacterium sp.]|uniref:leucine-rich repeat domain-containing protein n=1 Tax=Eubacterium sp. TaxID=142586 RepID=UPI003EFF3748
GVETIGRAAFAYCYNLKSITIPSTVKAIEDYAFFYCYNVTNLEIADGVDSIGKQAFSYFTNINEINLPKSITQIGDIAFNRTFNLTAINVDPQNTSYISDDGVLYNYDKTSLIHYPTNKIGTTYTIPDTVKSIERFSFHNNVNLKSMVIPSNVEIIKDNAFLYCDNLSKVIFEEGVKIIEMDAFAYTSINSVTIPKSVEKLYRRCFNIADLNKAYILNPNVEIEIITSSTEGTSVIGAKTIYGYEGSTAQEYAELKSIPFVVICNDGTENHTSVSTVTSPTCLEQGYTTYTCTTCGYEYKASYVDALGHTEVVDDAVEPDCTHTGLTEGSHCSVCNEILTPQTTVNLLGHSYTKEVIAPTCSQQGYTKYTCERCGDSYKDDFTDTTAHSFTYYVSDGNATCTKDGTKTASCDRCSATDTVTDFGSMLPHTCVWRIAAPATENQEGVEEYYCTVCNTVIETRAIPVLEPIEENEAPLKLIEDKEIVIDATSNLTTPYDDFRIVSGLGCAKVAWSTDESVDGYLVYTSALPDEDFELVGAVESNEADYFVIQNLPRSSIMYIRLVAYKTENDKLIQYPENKTKKVFIK